MSTQKEMSFDEVSREFNRNMAGADTLRADELNKLTAVRATRDARQKREQARLEKKLGPTHPRVVEIQGRLRINTGIMRDLKLESARAQTEIPKVDPSTWVLHGYVRDQNLNGVSNLTVSLFDRSGARIEGLGYACTDSKGYFRITARNVSAQTTPAYIRVWGKEGTFLYADKNALQPQAGFIEYREIRLSGAESVCVPPPDPIVPPPPDLGPPPELIAGSSTPAKEDAPPRDYWVVRGRVTDKSGKGLGGLFVSVYDEDLFFDDRLGEAETDAQGSYSLTYRTEDFRDLIEKKPDLYLKVIDAQGRTLHTLKGRVWYESGRVETIDIEIDR